jgi:hypothetical protein
MNLHPGACFGGCSPCGEVKGPRGSIHATHRLGVPARGRSLRLSDEQARIGSQADECRAWPLFLSRLRFSLCADSRDRASGDLSAASFLDADRCHGRAPFGILLPERSWKRGTSQSADELPADSDGPARIQRPPVTSPAP